MTEHEIHGWLREVARDVPDRTDDEALDSLRQAIARDRRRRRTRGGLLVAAAAAVVALVGWIAAPPDDQIGVTSEGRPAPTPTGDDDAPTPPGVSGLRAEADLDRYTGIHPPLVTITAAGHVEVVDLMGVGPDGEFDPYATVEADFPITWAAAGPRGTSVLLVNGADSTAMLLDLVEPGIVASWPNTTSIAASADHGRVARVEERGDGTAVIVEHLGVGRRTSFDPPPGGPQPSGALTWSPAGLLAVGHDDGSVAVFDPASDSSYDDAVLIDGPLHQPDWTGESTLTGTRDCCTAAPVDTVDVTTGARTEVRDLRARQIVAVPTGGSPWGWLMLDDEGTVRGTGGPDVALLRDVVRLFL